MSRKPPKPNRTEAKDDKTTVIDAEFEEVN
jgi:hypothetical protein